MSLPNWITATAAVIATALLPACDMLNLPEIKPGITSASEVRSRMGEPGFEHRDDDGTVTWEYSRQPQGVHCYMISFDRQQIVSQIEQVLNEKNFTQVRDGMSREDVRRLLGTPASKIVFNNLQEDIWEWRVEGSLASEETYFMVHFDLSSGGVKKTSRRVAMKG